MLKKKLLDTGYFIDNEYLSEYLILVTTKSKELYQEKHHILPRQYFKLINKPCDNSEANLAKLSYAKHCRAHYLLTLCTLGALYKGSLYTLNLMINSQRAKFSKLTADEQRLMISYNDSNDLFWTEDEIKLLYTYYPKLGTACIKFLPNRTKHAIKDQANLLGIKYDFESSERRRYTIKDDQFLIEHYQKCGAAYCAANLNKSVASVKSRAAKVLNITKSAPKPWSANEVAILKELYPKVGAFGLVDKLPDRKVVDIRKKAYRLGIKFIK